MKKALLFVLLILAFAIGCSNVNRIPSKLKEADKKITDANEKITDAEVDMDGAVDKAIGVHETKEQLREDVKEEDEAASSFF